MIDAVRSMIPPLSRRTAGRGSARLATVLVPLRSTFFLENWCRAERTLKALTRIDHRCWERVGERPQAANAQLPRGDRLEQLVGELAMVNAAPKSSLLMAMNPAAFRVGAKAIDIGEDALKAARLCRMNGRSSFAIMPTQPSPSHPCDVTAAPRPT
jgi:hypothetical protein